MCTFDCNTKSCPSFTVIFEKPENFLRVMSVTNVCRLSLLWVQKLCRNALCTNGCETFRNLYKPGHFPKCALNVLSEQLYHS